MKRRTCVAAVVALCSPQIASAQADRIWRICSAHPGEQPTPFTLALNRKIARALGFDSAAVGSLFLATEDGQVW